MKWKQREPAIQYDESDDILTKLGKIRGVINLDRFLNPTKKELHNPYLLENIEIIRDKIIQAIESCRKIAIFADVDADGCVSCSELYNFLKNFTDNVSYFHAQRSDGHSIGTGMDKIPEGTELLIIVDSSTSSAAECKQLGEQGIEVVIIDHHPPSEENPYATIVNPALDNYPNKSLSGSAVVWKVCQTLDDHFGTNHSENLIDLAAIGLISDMMNIAEMENRYIIKTGLSRIKNKGLLALFKKKYIDPKSCSTTDIGFYIAPMINGAARLDQIQLVLELLTSQDGERCKYLANELNKLNEKRKEQQKYFFEKFQPLIDPNDKVVVIVDDEIGRGYTGLVANDIAKHYKRHCIVLIDSKTDDHLSGSYRGYNDFDMFDYLSSNESKTFVGGHPSAGGTGVMREKLDDFKQDLNHNLQQSGTEDDEDDLYDISLDISEIDHDLIKKIVDFNRITGKGFESVKVCVNNIFIGSGIEKNVKKNVTLNVDCGNIKLTKFKTTEEYCDTFPLYSSISAVGTLSINKYWEKNERTGRMQQVTKNQLILENYQISP